jgi:hypothetical protein
MKGDAMERQSVEVARRTYNAITMTPQATLARSLFSVAVELRAITGGTSRTVRESASRISLLKNQVRSGIQKEGVRAPRLKDRAAKIFVATITTRRPTPASRSPLEAVLPVTTTGGT